jgi:hypothetical protein
MTPEQLAAIKARADAATAGPWFVIKSRDVFSGVIAPGVETIGMDFEKDANAKFTAHAREDIPALVAEVERLNARWDEAMKIKPLVSGSIYNGSER